MLNTEKELKKIGQRIKQLRVKKGYSSLETFAYDHKLSRVQYGRLESGATNLTINSLVEILNIHELTMEEFFQL